MKINKKPWPLSTAYKLRNRIDTNPDYQRPAVWTKSQKQLLIESILREYDIPKLYWREVSVKPDPAKVTLISVAWHPPINLIVQRFVDTMQGWMVQGKYSMCPYAFSTTKERDSDYLVWEVRAIDTKTLETRLERSAAGRLG